tara:strand:- start:911 stop:1090 length:180 start_codon:yes stop_codon:yes gene_type:complete
VKKSSQLTKRPNRRVLLAEKTISEETTDEDETTNTEDVRTTGDNDKLRNLPSWKKIGPE